MPRVGAERPPNIIAINRGRKGIELITTALDRMSADKGVGRAEAIRQSMLALVDNGEPYASHPSYWAPFIVVGEGDVSSGR